MHIQILDLISWHQETNLFRTLLYLTIIKKSMQILEVPKPSDQYCPIGFDRYGPAMNNFIFHHVSTNKLTKSFITASIFLLHKIYHTTG
jgi:hypothetical protein